MKNPNCPVCKSEMQKHALPHRIFYYRCLFHGLWSPPGFFRMIKGAETIVSDLIRFQKGPAVPTKDSVLDCPNCHHHLKPTFIREHHSVVVDQCVRCSGVWFDIGEIERISLQTNLEKEFPSVELKETYDGQTLPPSLRKTEEFLERTSFHPLLLLGFPVEVEKHVEKRKPFISYLLFFLAIVLTLKGLRNEQFLMTWAFYADQPNLNHGLNLITSLFLHAGLWHFIGNFYFFWVFADNIEDQKGPLELLLLFLCAGIGGNLAHAYWMGQGPSIGASGAISGMMTYYALRFPRNRLHTMRFYFPLSLSAPAFLMYFLLFDFVGAILQVGGLGGRTNYIAHIGGAFVGLLFFIEDYIRRPGVPLDDT